MFVLNLLLLRLLVLSGITTNIDSQCFNAEIIAAFNKIQTNPEIICFTNQFNINNKGGHIQGVQFVPGNGSNHIFLSGSSNSVAYLLNNEAGDSNKVIWYSELMKIPYKHAGGFQVFDGLLAVGIEDNDKKDKSKVCIYKVSNPKMKVTEPVAVIEREGEPYRATAGCVGITRFHNKIILTVGDWDTKHLDFYSATPGNDSTFIFKKISTINTVTCKKDHWYDKNWLPYQNINLIHDKNCLYLVGLGQNNKEQNIADLFSLNETKNDSFELVKLASKSFQCSHQVNFKAGAGVYFNDGKFEIFASGHHVESVSYLNHFKSFR